MRRRQFLAGLGSAATVPGLAIAQPTPQLRLVGILDPALKVSPQSDEWVRIFKEKVQSYGWIEGQTIRFERPKAGTDVNQGKREATALVDLKPDVLVASSTVLAALAERTSEIPIVFLAVADPIRAGFSDSLAWPSRNMTGFALSGDPAMGGKIVQILKEVTPDL